MGAIALPAPRLVLDGSWVEGAGEPDEILDPATGRVLGVVPSATAADVGRAVAAARRAADTGPWATATPHQRSVALGALAARLRAVEQQLVEVVVAETGCPVTLARGQQVGLALTHLEYWAEAARRPELVGRAPVVSRRGDGTGTLGSWVVRREPYGVVAAITPYNFPLLEAVMKVGPALAAGNTVVLKPSPFTPYATLLLAAAALDTLPPGVLNVVLGGAEAGVALTSDPRVDVVSFTGSDAVGSAILAAAAPHATKVVLEMGGKSALVVCDDADLDLAVRVGAQNITTHAGQGCVLATRHVVDRRLHDEYVERLAAAVAATSVGDPTEEKTAMGPLIRAAARARVEEHVAAAVDRGARVVAGARRPDGLDAGFFYAPTVLADVDNGWPIAQQEVFGPVGVVIAVDGDEEAVAVANDSVYGLAGHVIARDTGRAFDLACRLRTGSVDLNGGPGFTNPDVPFGGRGRSGLGRENGVEGLDELTQLKTIKYHAG